MTNFKLQLFQLEGEELASFLSENEWTYHANPSRSRHEILSKVDAGYYSDGRETYWMIEDDEKLGVLMIDDIEDTIPIIDIRIAPTSRGKGVGRKTLEWLKDYLFGQRGKIRIEGYTRADNLAMRKCFTNAGFVKEGYLRKAWENHDGTVNDSVLYAAISDDWRTKTITEIDINQLPY